MTDLFAVFKGKELINVHASKAFADREADVLNYLSVDKDYDPFSSAKLEVKNDKHFWFPKYVKVDYEVVSYMLTDDITKLYDIKTCKVDEDACNVWVHNKTAFYSKDEVIKDLFGDYKDSNKINFDKDILNKVRIKAEYPIKLYGANTEHPTVCIVDTGIPDNMILYSLCVTGCIVVEAMVEKETKYGMDIRVGTTIKEDFKTKLFKGYFNLESIK